MKVGLVVLVMIVLVMPVWAVDFQIRQVTHDCVDMFPSADSLSPGGFLASRSNHIYSIGPGGAFNDTGMIGFNPVRFGTGIAYYDGTNGHPVVSGIYPVTTWCGGPSTAPRVNQDGSMVAFTDGTSLLVCDLGGNIVNSQQLVDPLLWDIASLDWAPDGGIYLTCQDKHSSVYNGYHLFKVDPVTFAMQDLGMPYSQIAISGSDVLMTSYNHGRLDRFTWTADGLVYNETLAFPGVLYWQVGGAANGSFALQDWSGRVYEASAIPEPGSILALGTGLIGLVGITWRRRR